VKYYLIAGEASGDLHGSNLIKQLKILDSNSQIRCWGGEKMADAGGDLVKHFKNLAFMGFVEVIKNLKTILSLLSFCKKDILSFHPDVLVLIDYPGFNLRIAKWAKKQGIKVVYYITPQVWAWHKSRVHDLGKYTELLIVILPFEPKFFNHYGYKALYVGHPLLDAIHNFSPDDQALKLISGDKEILALLPGSRKQEIKTMLPVMLQACKNQPYHILIAAAPSIDDAIYEQIITDSGLTVKPTLLKNQTYTLLSKARYAFVSSGTATLETALFGVPQVVCYKGNIISYHIAKWLIDLKYISLVNLIADKEVVKELIQNDLTADNLVNELENLKIRHVDIQTEYKVIKTLLGEKGASEKAARAIFELNSKG
jgi:lipid-A-disaccharide synthase